MCSQLMASLQVNEFNPDLWNGYLDEPIQLTMNDFLAGAYATKLREPRNKSSQRIDRHMSVKLLHDMVVRIAKPTNNCVEGSQKTSIQNESADSGQLDSIRRPHMAC